MGETVGERIDPLEPDLVGEYFVIQCLLHKLKQGEARAKLIVEKAAKTSLRGILAKSSMVLSDFADLLADSKLGKLLLPPALISACKGPPYCHFGGLDWDKLDERVVDGKRQVLLITRECVHKMHYQSRHITNSPTWGESVICAIGSKTTI